MRIYSLIITLILWCLLLTSCSKDSQSKTHQNPDSTTSTQAANIKVYDSLVFNAVENENQYFSTIDSSVTYPKSYDSLTASQIKNIDILYIHDYNYDKPGFMNPYIAAQQWYWNDDVYYYPWLSSSVNSELYLTTLDSNQFDSARRVDGYLNNCFNDSNRVHLSKSQIFPAGGIVGGRNSMQPDWYVNYDLAKGKVFGFYNVGTGKKGLILIRYDQENGWPDFPVTGFRTKVDILKEK